MNISPLRGLTPVTRPLALNRTAFGRIDILTSGDSQRFGAMGANLSKALFLEGLLGKTIPGIVDIGPYDHQALPNGRQAVITNYGTHRTYEALQAFRSAHGVPLGPELPADHFETFVNRIRTDHPDAVVTHELPVASRARRGRKAPSPQGPG